VGAVSFAAATALFAFPGTGAPEGNRHYLVITAVMIAILLLVLDILTKIGLH
jgi:hypothetical protein